MRMARRLWASLENSWIQTCGVGWTSRQIAVGYAFSVLLALGVVGAAYLQGLGWSWVQATVAGLVAWDLFGGAIGYSHLAMKRRSSREAGSLPVWHHNLQHIHPLILIFFADSLWLGAVAGYWFATFLLYVIFLEVQPATGRRRLGETGQRRVVGVEIAVALALVAASWSVSSVTPEARAYGIVVYAGMVAATAVLLRTPLAFQRTTAIIALAVVLVVVLVVAAPPGFAWLVPIYLIKLLVGYTAREPTSNPP
jgi:hypothetical protein